MTSETEQFDVAVLGGGPGGYCAALRAAVRGARVCCVEAGHLGGTCLNVGCIPTKAMLHAGELMASLAEARRVGISTGQGEVDGAAMGQYIATTVAGLRTGLQSLMKARRIEIVRGRGRLTAPDCIAVEGDDGRREISAKSVIIATGSRPVRPGFLPWDSGYLWTTDEATTAAALPESVIILGGGVIGCELATAYAELGVSVTLVEMLARLVDGLGDDASRAISRSLKKLGVTVMTGRKIVAMTASDASVTAEIEGGEPVEAARAIICVGRAANVQDIGLEDVGVEMAGPVIAVDDHCRTNIDALYAAGDVAETRQYAHLASRMGIVAADNATGHEASDDRRVVPAGVYTHPQVAAVGLTEAQAKEHFGDAVRVSRFGLQALGLAQVTGQGDGMVKLFALADTDGGSILGGLIIAPHATDLIQELTLAVRNGLTVEQVANTIHAHPTLAESIGEAAESWMQLPLHSLR